MTVTIDRPQVESPSYLREHEECDENFIGSTIVFMSNTKGRIKISVCDGCGYEGVECLHLYNVIDDKAVTITCCLCGR